MSNRHPKPNGDAPPSRTLVVVPGFTVGAATANDGRRLVVLASEDGQFAVAMAPDVAAQVCGLLAVKGVEAAASAAAPAEPKPMLYLPT